MFSTNLTINYDYMYITPVDRMLNKGHTRTADKWQCCTMN